MQIKALEHAIRLFEEHESLAGCPGMVFDDETADEYQALQALLASLKST